jgi:acetylornithine deacetylase/succinyl-diaminopimelate desuccinylase-like protein
VADHRREWLANAEYSLSELGAIEMRSETRAPVGLIVISEKTGLPFRLIARGTPGHGSMPWPDTAPHRLIRALNRLLATERPPRVLPEVREYFAKLGSVTIGDDARRLEDIETSLRDPAFRARFLGNRHHAALVRTTFAITMLRASEKQNVIPPEATADIDCRLLAGDDPDEVLDWVRGVVGDEHVEVKATAEPKQPNLSPPDTELYKAMADTLRRRVPDVVVMPEILVAFTDSWVFRQCGLHAYGFSPFILDAEEWGRVHGNDERISLDNLRAGVRSYTELVLAIAGA